MNTPKTAEELEAHLRDEREIHMHLHDMGLGRRWLLNIWTTKLCDTDRCARILLSRKEQ